MTTKRRGKGEGSITRLSNGHYKMTLTIGVGADGKQKRKSVTAKTKTELMKRVNELRATLGQSQGRPMYFKELVEMYMNYIEGNLRSNSLRGYDTVNRRIFVSLYDYRIDKITADMIDKVLDNLRKDDGSPLAPSTIKNFKTKISSVFNFAVRRNLLDFSPIPKTKKRKSTRKKVDRVNLPTESQMQDILKYSKEFDARRSQDTLLLYPLFLLAVSTGLRLGELLDIDRVQDIDLETNTIDVNSQVTIEGSGMPLKTKSSARRIYVQPDILRAVLKASPRSDKTTKLFLSYGRQVTYREASLKIYRFFCKTPKVVEGFTFHCFRHYHATYLLMHGVNVKEVSKRLGHSSITTTLDQYAHWIPEMDASAANTIGTSFIL